MASSLFAIISAEALAVGVVSDEELLAPELELDSMASEEDAEDEDDTGEEELVVAAELHPANATIAIAATRAIISLDLFM